MFNEQVKNLWTRTCDPVNVKATSPVAFLHAQRVSRTQRAKPPRSSVPQLNAMIVTFLALSHLRMRASASRRPTCNVEP